MIPKFNVFTLTYKCFNEEILSYHVAYPGMPPGHELIHIDNMLIHCPLHVYRGQQQKCYIPIQFDFVDLIMYKMTMN